MSGVTRSILAEVMADGKSTEAELMKALSPEGFREEKGQTIYSPSGKSGRNDKGGDSEKYLGRNGKDATPGR